jgi:hypothetical protein
LILLVPFDIFYVYFIRRSVFSNIEIFWHRKSLDNCYGFIFFICTYGAYPCE